MIIVKHCADMTASNTWNYAGYNTENDARACIKNYITKRLSISCLRGVAVLLRDRFDRGKTTKEKLKQYETYSVRCRQSTDRRCLHQYRDASR